MDSILELVSDIKPLLESTLPDMIRYLDGLERRGMFRMLKSTMEIRAKVVDAYSAEDIDRIGDGLVALLGILEKLSDPKVSALILRTIELFSEVDVTESRNAGPGARLAMRFMDRELANGLGVLMLYTKALGKLGDDTRRQTV